MVQVLFIGESGTQGHASTPLLPVEIALRKFRPRPNDVCPKPKLEFTRNTLDINTGPGMDVPLLPPSRVVYTFEPAALRELRLLSFDFNCYHPRQLDIALPGKSFSSLLEKIFRRIYSGAGELVIRHPVTCASLNSELKKLQALIQRASKIRLFDSVEVELTVVDAEELTANHPGFHKVPSLDTVEFNIASYVNFTQRADIHSGEYLCDGRFQRKVLKVEFGRYDDENWPCHWMVEAFTGKKATCLGGISGVYTPRG